MNISARFILFYLKPNASPLVEALMRRKFPDILPKSEGVFRVNLLLAITPVSKPTIAVK